MAQYNPIPEDTLDEIIAGAGGQTENKAETAINFLNEWAEYITQFIEIIKNFWNQISALFEDTAE